LQAGHPSHVEDGGQGIDLLKLPVLTTWPLDGGPFITLPCVVTRAPAGKDNQPGKRNVGMYRMQVYDGQTTGMHWQRQKNAAEQLRDRLRAVVSQTRVPSIAPLRWWETKRLCPRAWS